MTPPPEAHRSDFRPNPRMSAGGKLSFRGRSGGGPVPDDDEVSGCLVVGGEQPPHLDDLVPRTFDQVEVEIGCGKGAFLEAATAARPDAFLLAIEAAPAYARIAAARLKASGRKNGLVLVDNGKLFLQDRVDDAALDRVHVYYPDPWPKRRHWKHRLIQDSFPATVHGLSRAGALLHIATDHGPYARRILQRFRNYPDLWKSRMDLPGYTLQRPDGIPETRFERIQSGLGFRPRFMQWERIDGSQLGKTD